VRSALVALFDCFLVHPGSLDGKGPQLAGEDYWIEPVIGARAIEGYEEKLRPVLVTGAERNPRGSFP
jgi:hypothetical protein